VFLQPDCRSITFTLDADNGVVFAIDPKGEVSAYKGKQRFGKKVPLKTA
jgi:hypothetical protein